MNIAVLASGRGSNAESLMKAAESGALGEARICALLGDNQDAPAFGIAERFAVPWKCIPTEQKGARFSEGATKKYLSALSESGAEIVVLAGFMKIVPDEIISEYEGRIINLHPSLLPAYKGKDAIRRAYEAGEKFCGCTVHYVSSELDGGEIIAQSRVEILPGQTLEEVEQNVHAAEHKLLPGVVKELVSKLSRMGKKD